MTAPTTSAQGSRLLLETLGNIHPARREPKPEDRAVPITLAAEDRMRTALQLIASTPVYDNKLVALLVATAKAGLADDDCDPMCEVLR